MKHSIHLLILTFLSLNFVQAQQQITLENIWQEYKFFPNSVPGFNFQKDGRHYTRLEDNQIVQYDLTTGEKTATLFDANTISGNADFNGKVNGYTFSDDEEKILIKSESEAIYRYSTRAKFFVYDRSAKSLTTLFEGGKQRYATFNPQADKVGFVHANNMYYKDLANGKVVQITEDGKENAIINGATDWVYEEEFGFSRAFQWSANGEKIAFYRFDESEVQQFTMTNYTDEMYPEYETFKYPKVGEDNSKVTIHIYDTGANTKIDAAVTQEKDYYIPRIKWTNDPNQLCVFRMNRHQSALELLSINAKNGKAIRMLKEDNKYYIDIDDHLTFLENGQQFVWTSEKDGWNHIYLYDMKGKEVRQITKGDFEVTNFYGVDEANQMVYYQAAEASPLEKEIYVIGLDGKGKKQLSQGGGSSSAQFSSTFDYFVETFSTANTPAVYRVMDKNGKAIRTIEENTDLKNLQAEYGTTNVEFFNFNTSEEVSLNGWMIKPANFNENLQYPVLMYVYGGPGSQTVTNGWKGLNYWWFQMLAQQGFIVVSVDNRGTGGRGEEFKKMTYLQLGKYETIDQIEAAKYLGGLKYIDQKRIGIFGWSYGGYMSSLCILKGNEAFKAAIAVAPVTNWKWYDTIYTERYMRTFSENESGYQENSPVYFADRLKGDYLLVHGMSDDNVHFQHTAEMANALIQANKQYDTYFYPNRNHGIFGGNTRLHLYKKMTDFLTESLNTKKLAKGEVANPKLKIAPNRIKSRKD